MEKFGDLERSQLKEGPNETEYSVLSQLSENKDTVHSDAPDIPTMISDNRPLHGIVCECLLEDCALRPTAASLCQKLLCLCRSSIVRNVVLDIGKL